MQMPATPSDAMKACIDLCWECRATCQSTLYGHCLQMGGAHAAPDHVRLMTDCIEMCQTCADFMSRQSVMHTATCLACADVCDACAISCEQVGDEMMLACADLCQRCGQACRDMSHMKMAA